MPEFTWRRRGAVAALAAIQAPIDAWRTSYLTSAISFAVPGTVVAAARGDDPVVLAASGDAVLGSGGRALSVDDAFHIGSMTKLFTAALIVQLDESGALSLDDTLDTWFPEAPNGDRITVRMLLQHESGLSELDMALVGGDTPQQVIDDVFSRPPVADPETAYEYLNAGYIILGRLAEETSGRRYADLLRSRLIGPLGLHDTYLDEGGDSSSAPVSGYDLGCSGDTTIADCVGEPTGPIAVDPDPSPQWTGAWSAGGMVSTAQDQAVWIRALVTGDDVSEAHRAEMAALTPLSASSYQEFYAATGLPAVQLGEGTGLTSWNVPGVGRCLGHAGAIPGSNGFAAYCPDTHLTVVALNTMNPAGLTPGYPGLPSLAPVALAALTR